MENREYLVAKREIRGIEVFNALCTGFLVLRDHPELKDLNDRKNVLIQGVMSILYDPDLYEDNKRQAEEREKMANAVIDVMDRFRSTKEKEEDHE